MLLSSSLVRVPFGDDDDQALAGFDDASQFLIERGVVFSSVHE